MSKHTPEAPQDTDLESAYIIHPEIKSQGNSLRALEYVLEETQGLARAIDLEVCKTKVLNVSRIQAGSFIGKGQRDEIGEEIKELKPNVVVFNHPLSPVQQRNLEKAWGAKVIDRTGLILEIFGARAQTKEGRLQVELAALDYQRSRLVRSWTHLERQRGATGFIGGPGETQIELDRRMIGDRITRLKKELDNVRRTRELGRHSRARIPLPIVALVGYTNAGKSTLFNVVTESNVFAEDLPFATLDPTLRRFDLPNNQQVILSDTVGFISDLPTHLVASFRATLEQTIHGDAIVHVIDVSRPDWRAQKQDVVDILKSLGIEYESDERIIEAYNKVDMLDEERRADFVRDAKFSDNIAVISALSGQGLDELLGKVVDVIAAARTQECFHINAVDGKALSWLYEHAEVLSRKDDGATIELDVMIEPEDIDKFQSRFSYSAKAAS